MRFTSPVLAAAALVLLGLPAVAQADSARIAASSNTASSKAVSAVASVAPAANPVGRLEVARQSAGVVTVSGWSFDRNALTTAERIDIWQTAPVRKIAGHALTTLARPDVNSYYKITGNHGYLGSFNGDPGTDTFCAYGINIGAGANTMLGCAKVVIPTSAPLGHIDVATAAGQSVTLAGWDYDPDLPTNADQVLLTDNGARLAPVTTTITRADINSHFHITGTHGWQTTVSAAPGSHSYCATAVNLGPARANVAIGCKTLTVSAPPPASVAWMYGTVWDNQGHPIVGATVNATTVGGTVVKSVSTDANGGYRVDVPLGTYHLCVVGNSGSGPDVLGYLDQCYSSHGPYGPPDDLALTVAGGYGDWDLDMLPAAVITGRVTDTAGNPLAGVAVGENAGDTTGVVTGADGTYRLRREAGYQTVCFDGRLATGPSSAAGYLSACWGTDYLGTPVSAQAGQTVPDIDGQLAPAAKVVGHVTDADGHALSGARVVLYGGETTTDKAGNFDFLGQPSGNYSNVSVAATSDTTGGDSTTGYLSWCPGGDTADNNCQPITLVAGQVFTMNAVLVSAAAVSGVVTDSAGKPMAGVQVQADNDGAAVTAANGTYRINGLPGRSYSVCFRTSGVPIATGDGYLDQCWQNTSKYPPTPVALTLGHVTSGINATLQSRSRITGKVTDAAGTALADVQISGYFDGDGVGGGVGGSTDSDGTFTLPRLDPGTYHLCFQDYSGRYAQACYQTDIVVVSGHTATGINQVLPLAATITGKVTDDQGNPLVNVHVTNVGGYPGTEDAYTGADGTYTLTGLDPGSHQVCFEPSAYGQPPLGYTNQCWKNVEPDGTPTSIDVVAGQKVTGIDATIHLGAAISGHVTDSSGTPLANVQVRSDDGAYTSTDANGDYLLTLVTPGQRTVCFSTYGVTGGSSPNGYQNECYLDVPDGQDPTPITVTAHHTTTGIDQKLQANPASN